MGISPELLLQMFLSAFSVFLTAAIGVVVKRMSDHNEERKKNDERREAEVKEAERLRREEYDALKDGIIAILRDRVIQADMHFTERGYATISQKDNIQMMYDAYHRLGGNGVVTKSYQHIMGLPMAKEVHA